MTVQAREGVYAIEVTEQFGDNQAYFDEVGMIMSAPAMHQYMIGIEVMLEGGIDAGTITVETLLD